VTAGRVGFTAFTHRVQFVGFRECNPGAGLRAGSVMPPVSTPLAEMTGRAASALPPVVARLVAAVQDLSRARTAETVRDVVRHAARELVGADGATFVLRDHEQCHYVDEDAIAPLWKGQRFPITACISGWSMLHGEPVVIEDVFQDARIPHDAYRRTFVKSLVMVPIRPDNPVGAIGTYWSMHRRANPAEVEILQALANTTAVALENVQIYAELETRVKQRTRQLEQANTELESFAASVSHDLRAPLAVIGGSADVLHMLNEAKLDQRSRRLLSAIPQQVMRMSQLIEDLLRLARIRQVELTLEAVDLGALATYCARGLAAAEPGRAVRFEVEPCPPIQGDAALLRIALDNLLSNAWKYTRRVPEAAVTLGCRQQDAVPVFFVRDNGAGFPPEEADRLFRPFQRLHAPSEYPGTGVGLTTVANIIEKHGGRIWAEGVSGQGATFWFTLGTG
jgi:signal transduction histidine kinase